MLVGVCVRVVMLWRVFNLDLLVFILDWGQQCLSYDLSFTLVTDIMYVVSLRQLKLLINSPKNMSTP